MIKTFEQFENHIDCEIFQDYFLDLIDADINCRFANVEFGGFENVPIIEIYSTIKNFQNTMLENPPRSFKVEIASIFDRIEDAHGVSFQRHSMGDTLLLIEQDTYKKVYNTEYELKGNFGRISNTINDYAYKAIAILNNLPEE